jgi:outer membrane protein OmpA-like peptidoglycan-associated protein
MGGSEWPHLRFIRNTAWLSPESCATLARLADRLKENPSLQASLLGHTDDLGPAEVNQVLSLRRASRARAWLIQRGVAPDQIQVRGFGSSQPAVSGSSRESRAQNRRVEITLGERSP